MTLDDLLAHEAIRQTMATYNQAGDRMRWEDFANAFTEDGVLERVDKAGGGFAHKGRKGIVEGMTGLRASAPRPAGVEPPKFVRHHITTSTIEVTGPDAAAAKTYFHVYTQAGPDHAGYYVDLFRKAGERWLIAHRKIYVDWISPNSCFRTE